MLVPDTTYKCGWWKFVPVNLLLILAFLVEVLAALGLDAPTAKEKGKIMKELMPKVKGKADGKLVSEVVASFLS